VCYVCLHHKHLNSTANQAHTYREQHTFIQSEILLFQKYQGHAALITDLGLSSNSSFWLCISAIVEMFSSFMLPQIEIYMIIFLCIKCLCEAFYDIILANPSIHPSTHQSQ
jgi:hypothetical protein